jgi:hypothetical protein
LEPHAVPQNILDVEFKLFGSFTFKQFLKMLLGSLLALFIFLINIPWLIKLPLMGLSVVTGIGLAIIPNLGVWLKGYIRAIFVSPRYVWVKETKAPELLQSTTNASSTANQKVSAFQNSSKIDLAEISLDKLLESRSTGRALASRTEPNTQEVETQQSSNFDRLFNEIYSSSRIAKIDKESREQKIENSKSTNEVQIVQKQAKDKQLKTKQDYVNEINFLKQELSKVIKDQSYKEKEAEIMFKINELFQELKVLDMQEKEVKNPNVQSASVTNSQGQVVAPGQIIMGIVVSKSDKSIDQAKLVWENTQTGQILETITDQQGRFITPSRLPIGTYDVEISKDGHKFHTYKIVVGDKKLPAYKFREK